MYFITCIYIKENIALINIYTPILLRVNFTKYENSWFVGVKWIMLRKYVNDGLFRILVLAVQLQIDGKSYKCSKKTQLQCKTSS